MQWLPVSVCGSRQRDGLWLTFWLRAPRWLWGGQSCAASLLRYGTPFLAACAGVFCCMQALDGAGQCDALRGPAGHSSGGGSSRGPTAAAAAAAAECVECAEAGRHRGAGQEQEHQGQDQVWFYDASCTASLRQRMPATQSRSQCSASRAVPHTQPRVAPMCCTHVQVHWSCGVGPLSGGLGGHGAGQALWRGCTPTGPDLL